MTQKFHKFLISFKAWLLKKILLYSSKKESYKVGDTVKIIDASHGWGYVKPGDIGTIVDISSNKEILSLKVEGKAHSWTVDNEPQYIVPYRQHVKILEDEVTKLPRFIDEKIEINHKLF